MEALPSTKEYKDKYYIGFFEEGNLIAVMDLIAEFPNKETMYIGFFMVGNEYSGKNIESTIIKTCLKEFQAQGFSFVRLGYMKGNPQSKAFWSKCGFLDIGVEKENDRGISVVLEKTI